jgi:hypothetical protein
MPFAHWRRRRRSSLCPWSAAAEEELFRRCRNAQNATVENAMLFIISLAWGIACVKLGRAGPQGAAALALVGGLGVGAQLAANRFAARHTR